MGKHMGVGQSQDLCDPGMVDELIRDIEPHNPGCPKDRAAIEDAEAVEEGGEAEKAEEGARRRSRRRRGGGGGGAGIQILGIAPQGRMGNRGHGQGGTGWGSSLLLVPLLGSAADYRGRACIFVCTVCVAVVWLAMRAGVSGSPRAARLARFRLFPSLAGVLG